MTETAAAPEEKLSFQAEVSRLLDIVAHSLYSEKEIFLRELISNAADACDRLRYEAQTKPDLAPSDQPFKITLTIDKPNRTLTVSDNGIGMSRDDLVKNLGTIARSGTSAFLKDLSGDAKKDVSLIGQFGVGFYSAFMVAKRVRVYSHSWKAGEAGHVWTSDGSGSYEIEPSDGEVRAIASPQQAWNTATPTSASSTIAGQSRRGRAIRWRRSARTANRNSEARK